MISSDAGATSSSIILLTTLSPIPTLSPTPSSTLSPASTTSDNPNHRPFAGGLLSTTAGFRQKYVFSNGFFGPAAGGGGASATRRGRPRDQAVGPRPSATASGALPAR